MSRYFNYTGDDYVAHFGIKGMKWGVRRFQKSNGSLTPSGKTRYLDKPSRQSKLEAKYRQKGKSKAEAEAAAKKRIEIEKTIAAKKRIKIAKAIAIGAGITLGTAATVALIKKYKGHSNNIIAEVKDKPMDNWVKMADTATDKFQQKVKPEAFEPKTFKPAGFTPNGFKPEGFDFDTFKPKGTTYSSATGANWTDLLHKAEIKNPGLINDIENILEWD